MKRQTLVLFSLAACATCACLAVAVGITGRGTSPGALSKDQAIAIATGHLDEVDRNRFL